MTLSRILCKTQEWIPSNLNRYNYNSFFGNLKGTCCLCGRETVYGFKKKFGANFTAGSEVSSGNVICEHCIHLVKHSNELRRSMWILTENNFYKFKKAEAKEVMLNLPDEPFFLYLTNTWQKVGWIKMLNLTNSGKDGLICVCMDYDVYFFELEVIKKLFKIIEPLRELKIPKQELESGNLSMHHLRKLEDPRETQRLIKRYALNPIWRLCVYLNE